jgi:hypothetical protein
MREVWIIKRSKDILDNRFFDTEEQAKNYIVWKYPKRRFKKPEDNTFICAFYGTVLNIVKLNNPN